MAQNKAVAIEMSLHQHEMLMDSGHSFDWSKTSVAFLDGGIVRIEDES